MAQKTRVLYLITKSNWGGAQRYVFDLATSLDKNLFDVSVTFGGNGILKERLTDAGIKVVPLRSLVRDVSIKKELLSLTELWHVIKNEKPDVIHLNSSKAGILGAVIARVLGVKRIIFTAHAWAFNENRSPLSKFAIGFLHWLTVLLSHKTITVSDSVRHQMFGAPFIQRKMTTIHPGTGGFEMKTRKDARDFLDPDADENIVWIGTISELHPVKGLSYLIDAVAQLENQYSSVRFYIMGEGDQREFLTKKINELDLADRITVCGFVNDAKSYLKAFDIFVLPSVSEAFGYVLLESGLANVPVVASDVGGIPEIVSNGTSGILVPPKDPVALASALKKYMDDAQLRETYAETLKKTVEQKFSLQRMVQETTAQYANH